MEKFVKENWFKIIQVAISLIVFCLILFFIEGEYMTIGVPIFFLILVAWAYFEKIKECNKLKRENNDLRKLRYERKN